MASRSSYTEGTPCWVDLQTTDQDAAKTFYGGLFGWEFEDMPMGDDGVYSMATIRGENVAAISRQSAEMIEHGAPPLWNTYIAVDSVDAAVAKVAAAGGRLLMEPFDVMEAGRMAWVADPTGASVGLWQAGRHIGATLVNEPNTLTWDELISSDTATALAFYEAVTGVTSKETPMGEGTYTMLYVADAAVAGANAPMDPSTPNHWHVWFAVADADQTVAGAAAAGGTVLMAPMDIPIGRAAALEDPQGARFSVIALAPQP